MLEDTFIFIVAHIKKNIVSINVTIVEIYLFIYIFYLCTFIERNELTNAKKA